MNISKHAQIRMKQRGIPAPLLNIIEQYGKISHAPGGAEEIFLGKREAENLRQHLKILIQQIDKASGTKIIVKDNTIITMYKKYDN